MWGASLRAWECVGARPPRLGQVPKKVASLEQPDGLNHHVSLVVLAEAVKRAPPLDPPLQRSDAANCSAWWRQRMQPLR